MSIRYSVQFFDVLTEPDGSGWINELIVTVTAQGSQTITFHNDYAYLGEALCVRTNGRPMVAHVVVATIIDGNEVSRLDRRYFIGDPGSCIAVRFGEGADCQPFPLHDYGDDAALFDLGRDCEQSHPRQ